MDQIWQFLPVWFGWFSSIGIYYWLQLYGHKSHKDLFGLQYTKRRSALSPITFMLRPIQTRRYIGLEKKKKEQRSSSYQKHGLWTQTIKPGCATLNSMGCVATQQTVSHLICNHFSRKVQKSGSRKVVLQTRIFFPGPPLFSNQKKCGSMV